MNPQKKYSLIVIGAGISGLSTALAWTKVYNPEKEKVLVIEKNRIPGGCVSTFARKGYRFDTTQIIPDLSDLLDFFEIDVPLLKFEHYYARIFIADPQKKTSTIIPIPSTIDEFQKSLTDRYPEDKEAIVAFFDYCISMHNELVYLKTEPTWRHLPRILIRCQKIIANSNKTYHQFLQKFNFKNPELIQVLDTFSTFSGLSGDRCAALLTASAMITTLKGSYRPQKGFIQFPVALMNKLKEAGGEVMTNTRVQRIITENNRVKGVELENGEIILADHVVSSTDTKFTFNRLVNVDGLSNNKYFKKVERMTMSPSGFAVHIGLDEKLDLEKLGFNCGYNVLTSDLLTHAKMFDAWENNELLLSDKEFHMGVICPSLQTGGKPYIIIHVVPVPTDKWVQLRIQNFEKYKKEKYKVAEFYIQKVEEYMIPDFRKHIQFIDVATPATFSNWLGSPTGSQYDMMPVPSNFGKNRLPSRTPIQGLFIPKFSHGIWPSMQAGLQIVDMISGGKIMNGSSSYSQYEFDKTH